MKRLPRLPVTREHGSWAVLAVPLIVGLSSADRITARHALLVLGAIAAFLSYVPVQSLLGQWMGRDPRGEATTAARPWAVLLLGTAGLVAVSLMVSGEMHVLVWSSVGVAGFVAHALLTRRLGKSAAGDLSAVAGLSAGAPAMRMLGSSGGWTEAWLLWVLMVLFFGCSVVYVHMKINATARRIDGWPVARRLRFGWITIVYHIAVILAVMAIVSVGGTSRLAIAAFLPMFIHALVGTARLGTSVRFKRLGLLLLAHSLVFAAIMSAALSR